MKIVVEQLTSSIEAERRKVETKRNEVAMGVDQIRRVIEARREETQSLQTENVKLEEMMIEAMGKRNAKKRELEKVGGEMASSNRRYPYMR